MSIGGPGRTAQRLAAAIGTAALAAAAQPEPAGAEPQVECSLPSGLVLQTGRTQCRDQFGLVLRTLGPAPAPAAGRFSMIEDGGFDVFGIGSGFFVASDGTVLTNAHVVERCDAVLVMPADQDPVLARVAAVENKVDLAIVETTLRPPRVAEFRGGASSGPGDPVTAAGFPSKRFEDGEPSLNTGTVTWVPSGDPRLVSLTFAGRAEGGMSGGPLLDEHGRVAGVVFAGRPAGSPELPLDHGMAIQAPTVRDFLDRHGVPFKAGTVPQAGQPAAVAAVARGILVRVLCLVRP